MRRDPRLLGDDRTFDVLVVGGGIAGAMVAWDATLRGFSVGLVEREDFASAASANNLRLLHGGLRYLLRGDLTNARAAMRERRAWLRIAPHLVEPLPVLVPARRHSLQNALLLRAVMLANDALQHDRNRGVDPDRHLPGGHRLSRREVLALAPDLDHADLTGGVVFHDARLYSSERLVIEVVRAAVECGAVALNYAELEAVHSSGGRVTGARVRNRIGGDVIEVRTRVVVNATGGAGSAVARLMLGGKGGGARYGAAFNVVVPGRDLPVAVSLESKSGRSRWSRGRQLLRVPWRDRELLGTGHVRAVGEPARAEIDEAAIAALLAEFDRASPGSGARIEDVALVHAGLLPLRDDAQDRPDRLLRRHRVVDHAEHGLHGAFTLQTVKFTTARLAAEEAVDALAARLRLGGGACRTALTRLPATPAGTVSDLLARASDGPGRSMDREVLAHLVHAYGTGFDRVAECGDTDAERLGVGAPVTEAEFVHAVREEMACTEEDVLRRRTELGSRGRITPAALARARIVLDAELGRERWRAPAAPDPPPPPAVAPA